MVIYILYSNCPPLSDFWPSFVHSPQANLVNLAPRMGDYSEFSIRARIIYVCELWGSVVAGGEAQSEA